MVVLRPSGVEVRDDRPSPWRLHFAIAVALVLAVEVYLLHITPSLLLLPWVGTLAGLQTTVAIDRGRRIAEELAPVPSVEQVAFVVADALRATGLASHGSEAVTKVGERDCVLGDVDDAARAVFRTALAEALSPVAASPYAVRRWVRHGPADNAAGLRAALGLLRPDGEEWHAVPTVLASTEQRAQAFAVAWDHWIGGDPATPSPATLAKEGTTRGARPLQVTA